MLTTMDETGITERLVLSARNYSAAAKQSASAAAMAAEAAERAAEAAERAAESSSKAKQALSKMEDMVRVKKEEDEEAQQEKLRQ